MSAFTFRNASLFDKQEGRLKSIFSFTITRDLIRDEVQEVIFHHQYDGSKYQNLTVN